MDNWFVVGIIRYALVSSFLNWVPSFLIRIEIDFNCVNQIKLRSALVPSHHREQNQGLPSRLVSPLLVHCILWVVRDFNCVNQIKLRSALVPSHHGEQNQGLPSRLVYPLLVHCINVCHQNYQFMNELCLAPVRIMQGLIQRLFGSGYLTPAVKK